MIYFWQTSSNIRDGIYIPKFYNPEFEKKQRFLVHTHDIYTILDLFKAGVITIESGNEIGKAAYGTGDIPFVRTSDIANWEIKSAPKQGVSKDIYDMHAIKQDVQVGDILFVRDGTYLIGNNCFITEADKDILYQSHILKLRVINKDRLDPHLMFLALNTPFVQDQIRSVQFTADIIDTLGQRFYELAIPIPKDAELCKRLVDCCASALNNRMIGKAFIKHCPKIIEEVLMSGTEKPIRNFLSLKDNALFSAISNETITNEFGVFSSFWQNSANIVDDIYLPTYYDMDIDNELKRIDRHCHLRSIAELVKDGIVEYHTGNEIGKMAYGTGDIPFLRTSDFANWEIIHNPKQGVSEDIYGAFAVVQDVKENDILLVRDGTYLVGSSCMVTREDMKSLYCGGLIKFRVSADKLSPFLFLGLLNSYIVKRQMRSKQFTRDVIDTLGKRIDEVILPIPKSEKLQESLSNAIRDIIYSRIKARENIKSLIGLMV